MSEYRLGGIVALIFIVCHLLVFALVGYVSSQGGVDFEQGSTAIAIMAPPLVGYAGMALKYLRKASPSTEKVRGEFAAATFVILVALFGMLAAGILGFAYKKVIHTQFYFEVYLATVESLTALLLSFSLKPLFEGSPPAAGGGTHAGPPPGPAVAPPVAPAAPQGGPGSPAGPSS